jgi:SAM-dependent methyltransferase
VIYVGSELELFAEARNWKRYLANRLRPHVGRRVLEVGAGIGGTTSFMCQGSEVSWVCCEPDRSLADRIEEKIASHALPANCSVHCGTTADIDRDSRFDTIIYIDVLEHIEDDAGELLRAADLLLPSGKLIVLAPAHQWLFSAFDGAVGHYRRYTAPDLARRGGASLRKVRAFYLDSIGLLASLANRLLLKQSVPTTSEIAIWDRVMVSLSRVLDPLVGYRLGRSVVVVWERVPAAQSTSHSR